jgi:hypothetical protein
MAVNTRWQRLRELENKIAKLCVNCRLRHTIDGIPCSMATHCCDNNKARPLFEEYKALSQEELEEYWKAGYIAQDC